ncbi:MAG: HEPN domain-containing protein [Bacteroidales bacterium]|nr:HEPN domain-containing protein [Bacteroidales bacterium]
MRCKNVERKRYESKRGLLGGNGSLDKLTESQLETIDLLEPLTIEARYPSYKEQLMRSLSKERCEDILAKTNELIVWIKQQL